MPPSVQIFEYRVADASTGITLTEGCGAGIENAQELAYCGSINVHAPLETEYYVEIRSERYVEGTLSATQGKDYFCQLQNTTPRRVHTNPSFYESTDPARHELLGVSLLDAAGNEYPPDLSHDDIEQKTGDIERYHIKSHKYFSVELRLKGTYNTYTCLNTFQAP